MHMQSINSFIQGTTMKHPNNQAVNELTLKYALVSTSLLHRSI